METISILIAGLAVAVLSALVACYLKDPASLERRPIQIRHKEERAGMKTLEAGLKANEARLSNLQTEETAAHAALKRERADLHRKEQQERNRVQADLKTKIDAIEARIRNLDIPLQKLRADVGSRVTKYRQQYDQIKQAEDKEISNALHPIQRQFVDDYLRRYSIAGANIYGIGPVMAARLAARGYRTAADINWGVQGVYGIGYTKASTLMHWRQRIESAANTAMPRSLSQAQMNSIRAKYAGQKALLQQQIDNEARFLQHEEQAIKNRNAAALQSLQAEKQAVQSEAQRALQEMNARYAREAASITAKEKQLTIDIANRRQEIESAIQQVRHRMFEQDWQMTKTRRELEVFRDTTFAAYVKQTFNLRRVGP